MISHDPRATITELQKRSSKTGNRKRSGESQNVCGRRGNGRTEMGKNWTKGKGKNSQRKYGKQHRTGNGENITEIQNYPEEVHERREGTRDGTDLRRVCEKMKMKKTGRKEGEKKLNGNTLRTRAGNRGGLVLRRGKN